MEDAISELLAVLDVKIRQGDVVLELGCGDGRRTETIAARAGHVIAFDVSATALRRASAQNGANNVTYVQGDGQSLDGVDDDDVDVVVSAGFLGRGSPKVALGYVAELGRVLKPGGVAAFELSTDPAAAEPAPPPEPAGTSRRELLSLLGTARRAPQPAEPPRGFVPLDALGAVATQAGLELERIEGANTRDTYALARRPKPPG